MPSRHRIAAALCGLLLSVRVVADVDPAFYRYLDTPLPFCNRLLTLEASDSYFVPIQNRLPGREEYNQLVRLYRARHWESFQAKRDLFSKVFETSPLQEAADYLAAQAAFVRAGVGPTDVKDAERQLRQALVRYPKSELAPVVSGTMGAAWLRRGNSSGALSLFEALTSQYPQHELNCFFRLGAGEAAFQLGDLAAAKRSFEQVRTKCSDSTYRTAAQVREADIAWKRDGTAAIVAFEKLLQDASSQVETRFPAVLHNLGELRYRSGRHDTARYLLARFTQVSRETDECLAGAMKRLADIALFSPKSRSTSAGLYYAVAETVPSSVIGKFSQLHAHLLTLGGQSPAERERRLRIVDEGIESLESQELKEVLYAEKGLAWLQAGEYRSLAYLSKIKRMREGSLGALVRKNVFSFLLDLLAKERYSAVERVDGAVEDWIAGTSHEAPLRDRYESVVVGEFTQRADTGELASALGVLKAWGSAPLGKAHPPSSNARKQVAKVLLMSLLGSGGEEKRDENAALLAGNTDWLESWLGEGAPYLTALVWSRVGDRAATESAVNRVPKRMPASLNSSESAARFALGLAQVSLGNWSSAERELSSVKGDLRESAQKELAGVYVKAQSWSKAVDALVKLALTDETHAAKYLAEASEAARQGSLWKSAGTIDGAAKKTKLAPNDLVPIKLLVGRAHQERGDCESAVRVYGEVIRTFPTATGIAEARYRTGKCYLKLKKKTQAKSVLSEVATMNDPFWSPLAQNELKILNVTQR